MGCLKSQTLRHFPKHFFLGGSLILRHTYRLVRIMICPGAVSEQAVSLCDVLSPHCWWVGAHWAHI